MKLLLLLQLCGLLAVPSLSQNVRGVGKFEEVFSWRQMTYDIGGVSLNVDRFSEANLRRRRAFGSLNYNDQNANVPSWNQNPSYNTNTNPSEPSTTTAASVNPSEESGRFFIQYNNLPMGAERVGNRLFVTVPRRRFGIPSTLNVIDLTKYRSGSPPLTPYPSMVQARSVISVYRTRADECGRLWAVDTGVIEIPNNNMYVQRPAILVYDLNTDTLIMRHELKDAVLPATNTPNGLASITVEVRNKDCSDTYAYIPDLASYGLIVYSLRQNDTWRHSHNFYGFSPTDGDLNIAGQSFQWNDGIFSLTLGRLNANGCRSAYFHPMVSTLEFEISTCELQNTQANRSAYHIVGERGPNSQSTMHEYHPGTNVIFFADVGRDAISCWNVNKPLQRENVVVLARDDVRLSYPADLHVTGDEVWIVVNKLPRFVYSRLNTNENNFYVYRARVQDLIAGTACEQQSGYQGQQFNRPQRPRPGQYA